MEKGITYDYRLGLQCQENVVNGENNEERRKKTKGRRCIYSGYILKRIWYYNL